jgi:hypothetical protein
MMQIASGVILTESFRSFKFGYPVSEVARVSPEKLGAGFPFPRVAPLKADQHGEHEDGSDQAGDKHKQWE